MNDRVKGNTKIYGVIGNPIEHSLSPEIHNSIFDKNHYNYIYIPLKIREEDLSDSIYTLKNNFQGFNITIPHKEKIIPYLDEVDREAQLYGAVNTVKVINGKMIGYNTDGYGFIKGFEMEGIDIKGKKVLLLGAGGAAKVAAYEILKKGAFLTIANRNREKAKRLKDQLISTTGIDKINICGIEDISGKYFCIVNATPIGMYPKIDEIPIDKGILEDVSVVYDMIYNPYETKLLRTAKEYGCKRMNGFSMLFYQALRAQEIWMDKDFDEKSFIKIYKEVERYFLNREGNVEK